MISNIKTLLKSIALVPVATVMFAGSAQAQLLGDTVNGQFSYSGLGTLLNENAEVTDSGVEFNFGAGNANLSLDVKDDSFDIIYDLTGFDNVGDPTSWSLFDLGFDSAITDVALVSGDSNLINDISFTDDSIRVDIANVSNSGVPNTWSFNVETANVAESVPEPTTILGLFAVGGFGVVSRRKKQAAK